MPGLSPKRYDPTSTGGVLYLISRSAVRYFITGHPLWGDRRDNATLTAAATKDYRDRPTERLSGPVWHRLARRWALLGVPALLYLSAGVPWWTRQHAVLFACAAWCALAAGYAATLTRRLRMRRVERDFAQPVWATACKVLGVKYRRRDVRRAVRLPADFDPGRALEPDNRAWHRVLVKLRRDREHDATPVTLTLPPNADADDRTRKLLATRAGAILGMPDPEVEWFRDKGRVVMLLRPRLLPPAAVTYAEVAARPEWATELEAPLVGLAPYRPGLARAVRADYRNDSPHILISGGSGTGKSVLIRALQAQRMHLGVGVIFLDFKRISHRWAHDLPGALYAWKIGDIHDLLVSAGAELQRRIATVVPEGDDGEGELTEFQTVDIVVEEINALAKKLRRYWNEIKMPGQPNESPAFAALAELITMGRELRMHVVVAGQRVSANTFGGDGGDLRESFAVRFMAKWSVQAWKMLAGGTPFLRWPSGAGRGLWAMIVSGEDTVPLFRVPFLTVAEARRVALSGVPCPPTPLSGGQPLSVSGADDGQPPGQAAPDKPLPLSAALRADSTLAVSLVALRKAATRPGFPAPVGKDGDGPRAALLYDLGELQHWAAARAGRDAGSIEAYDFTGPRRPATVYAIDVVDDDVPAPRGEIVLGYVGQTFRDLDVREWEHRGWQPWADLIIGNARVLWSGPATAEELDARELAAIEQLRPLYNYEGQEGASHAIPKPLAVQKRHERDQAANRTLWVPIDRYVPGGRKS